jgi:hypothetical protein
MTREKCPPWSPARKSDAALPIHLAVENAAPVAVVKELIKAHPEVGGVVHSVLDF